MAKKRKTPRPLDRFDISRIRSGFHLGDAWVSLSFRSPGSRTLQPLHFTCGPVEPGMPAYCNSVYLERDDQSVASYGGAKKILIARNRIELHLNSKGVKELGLAASSAFIAGAKLTGWQKASRVFREMATYSSGRAIEIS
jgi:hypothetical protein